MSKEKKIYFSLLISLLFVLMVCIGVGTSLFKETQQAHAEGSSRYVWVGGVEITADNEANITGTGISGSVSYDNTTKTLYLTNAKITETFYYYAVAENAAILSTNNYSGKMTIALSGTNTIDLSAKTGMTKLAGITRHYGDVVISGNSTADSLNIIMPECAGNNYAIDMEANGLTVSNCTLNASGGNSSNGGRCAGIYISMASYYTLSIQNAVVSATGGSSTNTGNHAITQATVSSSTVTAYSDGGVAFKTAPILSTAHIVKAGTSAGTAAVVKSPVDTTYTTNAYVNLKAAQTYNISYYDQGATSGIAYTGSTCQPSYIVSVGYDLPTPTRANYTFGGWFTTYNGTTAASNISSTDTGNKVFYAKWTPVSWNVSYNDDGATTASSGGGNKYTVADTSFTLPTTAPTKFGYVFTGWKVTSGANGGTGFVTNDVITTASRTLSNSYGNVTLTAQWQRETTTLLGAKFYEPQVWDCQRSPAYPIANKTMRISGLKTAYDKNLTVVPWESGDYVQFSIVFDTVSQIADETIRERIITSLMSYTGCTRAEIEAAAVVSEALYDSTGTKKADLSDIGLVWALGNEGFLYTALNGAKATSGGVGTFVSFAGHKNGDTVVYKTDKKTPYTKDEINAKTDVIKEGDSNTPSDNTLYFGGTVVNTNGEVLSGITVNLTYNETQYSFTTDSKGIFLSESIVQVSGVTAYTVALTDGTHGTVTYNKDFSTENGFGNDNSEYSATDIYVYTYPAVGNNENGEYLTHTIMIAVNGSDYGTVNYATVIVSDGSLISADENVLMLGGATVTATANTASAEYTYAFSGWSTFTNPVSGAQTITATFTRTPRSYSITYNQDGGSGATNGSYTCESETITLPNASAMSKTGYNFVGWTESDAAFDADSNPYILTIPTDSTGNKIYYAKWIAKTVKITLDKNGGDADGKATATYGLSALTGFTTVNRVGYTLNGFYTTQDGNGIKVINANGAIVGGISELTDSSGNWIYVGASTFTLYAQWTINTYTVTHNLSNITATANTVGVGKATYGTAYITKFTPTDGSLPSAILISVDGIQIEKDTDYSYNSANGNIEIFAAKVVGDIVITAKAIYKINYYSVEGSKVTPITIPSSSCTKEYVIGSNDFALDDGAMQEAKGDGYAVIGIYKDSACATVFDYTAMKEANDYSYLTDGTNIYIQYVRFHDGTGEGNKTSPYIIKTADQLMALISGYTYVYDDYFKIGADITLSADLFDENGLKERQVLGLSNEFVGFRHFHIDGDNHTITTYGLIVSNVYDSECLMISLLPTDNMDGDGEISNLTVSLMRNVTYDGSTLKTTCAAGVLAGVLSDGTTLYNVTINGNGKKLNINHSFNDSVLVGGLSGSLMANAVVNCLVKDIVLSAVSESFVGGFVGVGRANILNGSVEGLSITIGADSIGGGFVGYAIQSNIVNSYIYDYSFLSQSNSAVVGGMAGLAAAETAINNCYAYGENTYQNRAGIAFIDDESSVINCHSNLIGGGLLEGFTIADGVAIIDFKATNVALNTNRIADDGLIDIFGEDTSYTCNAWYLLSLTDDLMSQFARTYKVSYTSDGATGTLPDEKYLIGGSSVTVAGNDDLEKDYYDFDGWKDGLGNAYGDNNTLTLNADTVLTAQWKQIRKSVDFGYGGGTPNTLTSAYYWIKDGSLYDAIEGGNSIEVPIPTKIGYIFDGWEWFRTANWDMYDENGNFVTENSPAEDVEVQAQWYAISYTVTFASGTNYTITATKDGVDFASGSKVTIEDMLVFTITPNAGYTAGTLIASGTLRTFVDKTLSLVNEDITVNGSATANTNTAYKVEHYFETLDGIFAIDDTKTQTLYGTTDTAASASALTVTGFNHDIDNVNKVESENIVGNGELVLKVYYKRTLHTVTWKNGETNVEIDYNVKYGAMPTFDGETPEKANSNEYVYEFIGWTPAVTAVSGNATYVATFKAKPIKVTTPEPDSENPEDQDKIDAEIENEDGFEPDTTLIVKVIAVETAETTLSVPDGKEFAKTYNATLYVNNVKAEPSGVMTIKFAKSASIPQADSYTIIIAENGDTVQKTATVEGDYLVFTTSVLGDFAIIVDKVADQDDQMSLLWLIILLAIINAMEFVAIGILIRRNSNDKKKAQERKNNSVKMNGFVGIAPLLAAVNFNSNEIVAVAILGASAVILAGVIVYLALKSYKAKKAQIAAVEEVYDGTGDMYAISNTENTAAIADTEEDLKVVMAVAAVKAVVHIEINKKTIADYLENTYKDKVVVNRRGNYTSTGLPLADTHYIVSDGKKSCFTYVYELDGGKVFLLIKTDEKTVKTISKKHSNIHKSRFPKAKTQWYSLIIDDSFKDGKDLFDIVDIIVNTL